MNIATFLNVFCTKHMILGSLGDPRSPNNVIIRLRGLIKKLNTQALPIC